MPKEHALTMVSDITVKKTVTKKTNTKNFNDNKENNNAKNIFYYLYLNLKSNS